jgi:protoporphyrinogen oxidase
VGLEPTLKSAFEVKDSAGSRPCVIVLGGGCAGLMAGWELSAQGYPVTVLEKEDTVGGLAASFEVNGNFFDIGTHHFHTDDPDLLARIIKLLDGELIATDRKIQIKFGNKYFNYPLRTIDIFLGLPPIEWFMCFGSLFWTYVGKVFRGEPPPFSAEDVIVSKYGRRLYKIFFKDYTTKFWGVSPSALSADFAQQRIPRLDAVALLKKASEFVRWARPRMPDQFVEDVVGKLYYHPRGIGEIYRRMAEEVERLGGCVRTGRDVKEIVRRENGYLVLAQTHDGEEEIHEGSFIISTIPLRSLVRTLGPSPPEKITALSEGLKYRSLVVVGLQLAKPKVIDSLFLYFRDRSFNRIAEPKNSGLEVNPPEHTVLLAELSCNVGDEVWSNDRTTVELVIEDLMDEGLCRREEVVSSTVLKAEHAYPVYHLGYENELRELRNYLDRDFPDIYLVGRQGTFTYINMHVAMKMALDAAKQIRCKAEGITL